MIQIRRHGKATMGINGSRLSKKNQRCELSAHGKIYL